MSLHDMIPGTFAALVVAIVATDAILHRLERLCGKDRNHDSYD